MITEFIIRHERQKDYFVRKSDGGELKAQIAHQNEKGEYYYKERDRGNDHNDVIVPSSNICTVERYYRHNKSIPSLRHLIVRAKQVNEPDYKPHFCIIYSNSSDELEKNSYNATTWKFKNCE